MRKSVPARSVSDFDNSLTLDEAAEYMGCHRRTIEANIARGNIKVIRIASPGGRGLVRIRQEDLDRWGGPMRQGKRPKHMTKKAWSGRPKWGKDSA